MSGGRTITGRVVAFEQKGRTPNGNPTYTVVFHADSGDFILGTTKLDSVLSFEIDGSIVGKPCEANYTVSLRGLVFTSMRWGQP